MLVVVVAVVYCEPVQIGLTLHLTRTQALGWPELHQDTASSDLDAWPPAPNVMTTIHINIYKLTCSTTHVVITVQSAGPLCHFRMTLTDNAFP